MHDQQSCHSYIAFQKNSSIAGHSCTMVNQQRLSWYHEQQNMSSGLQTRLVVSFINVNQLDPGIFSMDSQYNINIHDAQYFVYSNIKPQSEFSPPALVTATRTARLIACYNWIFKGCKVGGFICKVSNTFTMTSWWMYYWPCTLNRGCMTGTFGASVFYLSV